MCCYQLSFTALGNCKIVLELHCVQWSKKSCQQTHQLVRGDFFFKCDYIFEQGKHFTIISPLDLSVGYPITLNFYSLTKYQNLREIIKVQYHIQCAWREKVDYFGGFAFYSLILLLILAIFSCTVTLIKCSSCLMGLSPGNG